MCNSKPCCKSNKTDKTSSGCSHYSDSYDDRKYNKELCNCYDQLNWYRHELSCYKKDLDIVFDALEKIYDITADLLDTYSCDEKSKDSSSYSYDTDSSCDSYSSSKSSDDSSDESNGCCCCGKRHRKHSSYSKNDCRWGR